MLVLMPSICRLESSPPRCLHPLPPQGHHQRPWTITEREFCNNMHKLFRPASFFAAGLAGMAAAGAPALWDIW